MRRLFEIVMALVITGALLIFVGPYFGVWILYWMTHFFG